MSNIITQWDDKIRKSEVPKPKLTRKKKVSRAKIQISAETQTSIEKLKLNLPSPVLTKESNRYEDDDSRHSFETFGRTERKDGTVVVAELNDTFLDDQSVEVLELFEDKQKDKSVERSVVMESVERTVVVDTNAVEITPRATRRNDKLRSKIDDLLTKISASKSSAANVEEYKRNRDLNLQDLRRCLDASTAEVIEKTRVIKVQECQTN